MTFARLIPAVTAAALLACSPPSAMPPPVPLAAGSPADLGVAMTAGYGHTGSYEAMYITDEESAPAMFFGDAQAWILMGPGGKAPQFGFVGSMGLGQLVTFGAMVRYTSIRMHNFRLGIQADGGWAWVRASMPVAYAPRDGTWLWSNPALQVSPDAVNYGFGGNAPTVQVPLGLSQVIGRDGRGVVHFEIGYRGYQWERSWRSKVYAGIGVSGHPIVRGAATASGEHRQEPQRTDVLGVTRATPGSPPPAY